MVRNDGLNHVEEGLKVIFNYFGKKIADNPQFSAQLAIWKAEFKDYTAMELRTGITKYLGTTKNPYLPMPQDVKDFMHKGGLPSAEVAWANILICDNEKIGINGDFLKVLDPNPITQKIYNGKDYAARKEFISNYNAILASGKVDGVIRDYNSNVLLLIEESTESIDDLKNELLTLSDLEDYQIAINVSIGKEYEISRHVRRVGSGSFEIGAPIGERIQSEINPDDPNSGVIEYDVDIRALYIDYLQNKMESLEKDINFKKGFIYKDVNGDVNSISTVHNKLIERMKND